MDDHNKNDNMTSVLAWGTIYDTEKDYYDYLYNIKSQDLDDCDFCVAFMTF